MTKVDYRPKRFRPSDKLLSWALAGLVPGASTTSLYCFNKTFAVLDNHGKFSGNVLSMVLYEAASVATATAATYAVASLLKIPRENRPGILQGDFYQSVVRPVVRFCNAMAKNAPKVMVATANLIAITGYVTSAALLTSAYKIAPSVADYISAGLSFDKWSGPMIAPVALSGIGVLTGAASYTLSRQVRQIFGSNRPPRSSTNTHSTL